MSSVEWATASLGTVATIKMGQSPPSRTVNEDGNGLPFIQGNAEFGLRNPLPVKFCTKPQKQAQPSDILLSVRAPVGALNLADKPLCIGRGLSAITATGVEVPFLWHALRWKVSDLVRVSQGSTFAAVNKADLCGLEIPFPPSTEQREIAAILSSVDDSIEKTQAVIDQVQVVKRGLMQELLTRGLPGRHTRFKQTEIGEIPEEWEVRALVDCCNGKGQYGANVAKADFKPGGIRYIRITDIDDNGALRDNAVGISGENADGYLLQLGDILFARSGATVGKAYMHRDPGMRSAFAGYLVRFRTKRDVLLPMFLREYLNTDVYWRWVGDRQRAQAQPNINATEYGQLPVPCAPLDEQRRVMEIAESFNSSLLRARAEVLGKQWLKRALMPVLLTGELRVTPGPEVA